MLTISKSPVRISLFGGGTDYPEYYHLYPGAVIGMAVSLYVYTTAIPMAGFADQRYRILYREIENVSSAQDIAHPVVREVLRKENYDVPLNISIFSDVPGGTGLGSSSAFTVGFIALIKSLKNEEISRYGLAMAAIDMERNILAENGGIQDQLHSAFGGFSRYDFGENRLSVSPVNMPHANYSRLNDSLFLVYTGSQRRASTVAGEQMEKTKKKAIVKELGHLKLLVDQAVSTFENENSESMIDEIGRMLNEAWYTKRSLSTAVSTDRIDAIHEKALALGAHGAKLCGAGGGGFMLVLAPSRLKARFDEAFGTGNVLKVAIDEQGARTKRGL